MSIEWMQTSFIHIPPCSQEIIDNANPIFLHFFEDAKWGWMVSMVTVIEKFYFLFIYFNYEKKSSTSLICNYIMIFFKYLFRNLCGKSANLVIWRLKSNGFYDEVVTIATKVNTCVLLFFLWVFYQNATYEPYRLQFCNYQYITHCLILKC